MRAILVIGSAIVGVSLLSLPALAQQKTVKACQDEWRANKDANQAKGVTEKAYVTQCRAGGSTAQPAPAASSEKKSAATAKQSDKKSKEAAAPAGGQKTVKACQEEWRSNKDANQAKGITEKAYVTQCRAGTTTAQPAPAPMAPPPAERKATTAPLSTSGAAPPAATAPTGANQYTTEAQARIRCGTGTVVWANLDSKIYHFAGHKDYGGTKIGAYMCERDATGQGMRASRSEKRPGT